MGEEKKKQKKVGPRAMGLNQLSRQTGLKKKKERKRKRVFNDN